ncbi:MAG TPA: methyltransferase [Acidimicrobiales bacterium]|jgi:16S rRNA (guanine1207-N2)-methyltransferase
MTTRHYFDADPQGRSAPRTVELVLPDLTASLRTERAVFSADRVDPGTKLLLQEAPPPPDSGDVLDLGCGYGPIAVTLARRAPGAHVWAVDVNQRALRLAAANTNGLGNVTVASPADVPPSTRFAALYSNPPIRVGKTALHDLLAAWVPRTEVAYLVVSKHLGADSLAQWMAGSGWEVTRLGSRVGYRILRVVP